MSIVSIKIDAVPCRALAVAVKQRKAMTMDSGAGREVVLAAFAKQVGWCESLGSPFTAQVLTLLAEDVAAGGDVTRLAADWPGDPLADALALRLAGALHALVLAKQVPDLAACYPPQPPVAAGRLRIALLGALRDHQGFVESFLSSPPQTNEVGRSAVLLGGFLQVAAETNLPLRLLEIGASAGLNLLWDRYRYQLGAATWGDPQSPVRLVPDWQGPLPRLDATLQVSERMGCDVAPIDLEDAAQRLRLRAFVWADQRDRLARLEGAIALARGVGQQVERADAASWARTHLAEPAAGRTTVLYHSIMWQYMPERTREEVKRALRHAGEHATASAPLAWLRFEPPLPEMRPELRLTLWPGGQERGLAIAQAHGSAVTWDAG